MSAATAKQPKVRLRLRTVLLLVSLSVLVLPAASLQVLRVYEGVLLRQTQASLTAQAAFASSIYKAALDRELDGVADAYGKPASGLSRTSSAGIDLATAAVLPPLPEGSLTGPADSSARLAGRTLNNVLVDVKLRTGASVRLVDISGVVVASTEPDLGQSLAHSEGVRVALTGVAVGHLRRTDSVSIPVAAISRNTAIEVHVVEPVIMDDRIVGAVLLARAPATIIATVYEQRYLLLQAATLVAIVVAGIVLLATRTLLLPIRRLGKAAGRLSRGETDGFEGGRPYRVVELAQLAASVSAMATNLQERARYVRDFAGHVNHEFKTPIAAMRGALELLREHVDEMTPDERDRFLANLQADVGRLNRLTLRMLELANADMTARTDELTDVVAVANTIPHTTAKSGGEMRLARVAREALEAVLRNLADNAVECGATGVDVCAKVDGDRVTIDVADDGPGISPGNRSRVFEPFFTTRRDQGGTGLGLPISRSLMRQSGGDLELLPTTLGTTFRITLPAS